MKNLFRLSVFLFLGIMLLSGKSFADVPKKISLQGRLTDSTGAPISASNKTFVFDFYSESDSYLFTLSSSGVTISNGLYSVDLELSTIEIPYLDQPLYVRVKYDGGSHIGQRTALGSSPFALNVMDGAITTNKLETLAGLPTGAQGETGNKNLASGDTFQVLQATVDNKGRVTALTPRTMTMPLGLAPSGTAGGDLTGTYPNPTIGAGVVVTTKIADSAVTREKISAINPSANRHLAINIGNNGLVWVDPPTSLPPTGAAGGDLTGTYPSPTIGAGVVVTTKIADSAVTREKISAINPSADRHLAINSGNNGLVWVDPPTGLPPTGTAGGDLTGTYPNPTIGAGVVVTTKIADSAVTREKISAINPSANRHLAINSGNSGLVWVDPPTGLPPTGAAGGDLTGTYPNPALITIAGLPTAAQGENTNKTLTYGGTFQVLQATVDDKGRVTVLTPRTMTMPTISGGGPSLPSGGSNGQFLRFNSSVSQSSASWGNFGNGLSVYTTSVTVTNPLPVAFPVFQNNTDNGKFLKAVLVSPPNTYSLMWDYASGGTTLPNGTSGYYLQATGATTVQWVAPSTAAVSGSSNLINSGAVYAGLQGKQNQIPAGTADNIVAYSGTAGILNTLTRVTAINSGSPSNSNIPTEQAVVSYVSSVSGGGSSLPTSGSNGQFLSFDSMAASSAAWNSFGDGLSVHASSVTVTNPLPTAFPALQSGQFLTNNGTNLSWAYAQELLTSSSVITVGTITASSGTITTFNATTINGVAADLAEIYPSSEILAPGEVVVISDARDGYIEKSKIANDTKVAGVISTKPGIVLNSEATGYQLALVGKVPVNVTNEGGNIKRGDLLTASSTPGYAMKAPDNPKPGTIIGKALENYTGSRGKILALVNLQ